MSIAVEPQGVMVGIDVGKYDLAVDAEGWRRCRQFANDPAGWSVLLKALPDGVACVVIEATGGYEKGLRRALQAAGYPLHVAHPVRVRAFATAHGVLAKTDPIDSAILRRYGRAMAPFPARADTAEREQLQGLLRRRAQLIEQRKAEGNRLDKHIGAAVEASVQRHIAWLSDELRLLDDALDNLLASNPGLGDQAALLQSVRGVGRQTALTMLADLPELGQCNAAKLTALAGLAPFARDSSTINRRRRVRGGRAHLRRVLYMAAVSAIRHNPDLKRFYERLRGRGKPGKVALVAVMRKLLLTLNAVVARQTPWTTDKPALVA